MGFWTFFLTMGVGRNLWLAKQAFVKVREYYGEDEIWGAGGHSQGGLSAALLLADPSLGLSRALLFNPVPDRESLWLSFWEKLAMTAARLPYIFKLTERGQDGRFHLFRPRVELTADDYRAVFLTNRDGTIPAEAQAVLDATVAEMARPETFADLITLMFARPAVDPDGTRPLEGKEVVLIAGEEDPFISIAASRSFAATLSAAGAQVIFVSNPCNHSGLIYAPEACTDAGVNAYLNGEVSAAGALE